MKIVITGSLGHISKPLAQKLVKEGHTVTVISSNPAKQQEIEALGATAAIGSVEDAGFMSTAFKGADAVYCMTPPAYYHDATIDPLTYNKAIGANYVKAIEQNGIRRVVFLSSFGAHLSKGTGFIVGSHYVEQLFRQLSGVGITFLRPASFYYNLLGVIPVIKAAGNIIANYGGDDNLQFVAPEDIATVAAEELVVPQQGEKIRYIASEELTGNEVAAILGAAIGKPALKWIVIPDEVMLSELQKAGMPTHIAEGLVELQNAFHNGLLSEDYLQHKPVLGKTKLPAFATTFAAAYNKQ